MQDELQKLQTEVLLLDLKLAAVNEVLAEATVARENERYVAQHTWQAAHQNALYILVPLSIHHCGSTHFLGQIFHVNNSVSCWTCNFQQSLQALGCDTSVRYLCSGVLRKVL